jgi:hypothetical protein
VFLCDHVGLHVRLGLLGVMDPRAPISKVQLSSLELINDINEWLGKKPFFMWGVEPETLKGWILENPWRTLPELHKLLEDATTTKMPGHANHGLGYFKQIWRSRAKEVLDANLHIQK